MIKVLKLLIRKTGQASKTQLSICWKDKTLRLNKKLDWLPTSAIRKGLTR